MLSFLLFMFEAVWPLVFLAVLNRFSSSGYQPLVFQRLSTALMRLLWMYKQNSVTISLHKYRLWLFSSSSSVSSTATQLPKLCHVTQLFEKPFWCGSRVTQRRCACLVRCQVGVPFTCLWRCLHHRYAVPSTTSYLLGEDDKAQEPADEHVSRYT